MSHDAFDDRRKALEEQFFQKHDKELVAKLKEKQLEKSTKEELTRLTGITNDQLLTSLADLNVGGAATLVMSLYPIVEVAWADGAIDEREKKVIADLAKTIGLQAGSSAYHYLTDWLAEKPEPKWHDLWAAYVQALVARMSADDKALLKATVLGRARVVAEVSGGFLGLAFRVSNTEQAVLDKLAVAFG